MNPSAANKIQRQISLPISKAVEIAWKSIRLRLARSLVVTSSIALAIAFLLSILAGEQIVNSMRQWQAGFKSSSRHQGLVAQEQLMQRALETMNRSDPEWAAASDELRKIRDELASSEILSGKLKSAGVATTEQEIRDSRIQTRWIIALALLVAFVGILNAMLMSVTERFREIGTMKCLGALDGFIVKLFLLESLFQGGVGTILGVVAGVILSLAAATWSFGGFAWKNMPWTELGVISIICLVIGMALTVAGALYPAWQAARMQPIAAMRVEV